jgi:hypothetical protein
MWTTRLVACKQFCFTHGKREREIDPDLLAKNHRVPVETRSITTSVASERNRLMQFNPFPQLERSFQSLELLRRCADIVV